MDPILVLLIVCAVAWWVYNSAYKSGKHEGSRKAYGVGYSRGRKQASSGCLIFVGLIAAAVSAAASVIP